MMNYKFLLINIIIFSIFSESISIELTNVYKLTSGTLDTFLKEHKYVLLKITKLNECEFCEMLNPQFEIAAQLLIQEKIYCAEIDGSIDLELFERFQLIVSGFPTLKFFINGLMIDYNGNLGQYEIVDWAKQKIIPAVIDEKSQKYKLDEYTEVEDLIAIYFGKTTDEAFQYFSDVALKFEDYFFLQTENFTIYKQYNPSNHITLLRRFDEKILDYPKQLNSAEEFAQWIDYYQFKKVENITYKSVQKIMDAQKPMLVLFHDKSENSQQARKQLKIAAEQLRGKIVVAESQIESGMGERFAEYMNITQELLPAVRIHWITDTEVRRYHYSDEITSQGLINFYQDWKENKLSPVYKSEPIPLDNEQKVIKKVVGKNFDEIIRNKQKDVLLVITVPWCGELCDKIITIFQQIQEQYNQEDLIFAEMDASLNEVEGLIIEGLPCIKGYPKNKKFGNIRYKNEYSTELLLDFIKFIQDGNQYNSLFIKFYSQNKDDSIQSEDL